MKFIEQRTILTDRKLNALRNTMAHLYHFFSPYKQVDTGFLAINIYKKRESTFQLNITALYRVNERKESSLHFHIHCFTAFVFVVLTPTSFF